MDSDLDAFAEEVAAAAQSPWQPRCIAAAFSVQGGAHRVGRLTLQPLTMQGWIDLDAARSWYLGGTPDPEPGDTARLEQLAQVVSVLAGEPVSVVELLARKPDEAIALHEAAQAILNAATSTMLSMRPPVERRESHGGGDDGFGVWLIVLGSLIAEVGLTRAEALATPVAQAHALIATVRRANGWRVSGGGYKMKNLEYDS